MSLLTATRVGCDMFVVALFQEFCSRCHFYMLHVFGVRCVMFAEAFSSVGLLSVSLQHATRVACKRGIFCFTGNFYKDIAYC